MSLTYTSYVSQIANLMVVPVSDPNFQVMLPGMLDYAELRLQRDLDLVDSSVRDTTGTFTTGSRNFNLPTDQGSYIVVDQLNVLTPVGSTTADSATRVPLVKCSIDTLDALWPSSNGSTVPVYFAMMNQGQAIVGPFPDQAYNVEVVGSQRFTPLYVSQTTSPLSVFFPDLLVTASMVFASGYQRNFGQGSDDPKMSSSWETQYQTLLSSAQTEESRKKFIVGDTTPQPATPKG